MIPSIGFIGYAHQCYLEEIINKIKKQLTLDDIKSFQIDAPEDLSENDLKYIKKSIEDWYNGSY